MNDELTHAWFCYEDRKGEIVVEAVKITRTHHVTTVVEPSEATQGRSIIPTNEVSRTKIEAILRFRGDIEDRMHTAERALQSLTDLYSKTTVALDRERGAADAPVS